MIGREHEIRRLKESLETDVSELIAVYGRRRVGKTYLIRNTFARHIKFEVTGLYDGSKEKQLDAFFKELKQVSTKFSNSKKPTNWDEAFDLLKAYIKGIRGKKKKVIKYGTSKRNIGQRRRSTGTYY